MENILITEYFHVLDVDTVMLSRVPVRLRRATEEEENRKWLDVDSSSDTPHTHTTHFYYSLYYYLTQLFLNDQSQLLQII